MLALESERAAALARVDALATLTPAHEALVARDVQKMKSALASSKASMSQRYPPEHEKVQALVGQRAFVDALVTILPAPAEPYAELGVEEVDALLAKLDRDRAELATRYRDAHPKMISLDHERRVLLQRRERLRP